MAEFARRRIETGRRFMAALLGAFLLAAALLVWNGAASAAEPLQASDFRMAGNAAHMRLAFHVDREPAMKWFLLRGPHRLAIDLPQTRFAFDPEALSARGLVREVRYGDVGEGASRVIVGSKGPFSVERIDVIAEEDGKGYRIVADIVAASEAEFDAGLADQAAVTGSTVSTDKHDRVAQPAALPARKFTIVIDPGHGGIDPGAAGLDGTLEKTITLAFALELRARLQASGRYDVRMTRERDEFVRLDDRVRIARQDGADLFISVHADTINAKGVRGATVYTVSDKASDAQAQALAERENLADTLAGIEVPDDNREVTDILIDLMRRETHGFSMSFARSLLGELSQSIGLINNPHRFAGFRVLRAPDVPSVLVELGYLSNAEDEAQLRDAAWRARAVDSIARAIDGFANLRVGSSG